VDFRILGPLDIVEEGSPLTLGAHKQRALLALLLLHRGEALSVDRLIDELWGERPPATAAKSIQVYISQLRKILGSDVVETRGRGYALRAEPEQLDAVRFEELLERGRDRLGRGEAREAARTLREALALWRGAPLAEFEFEAFAQAEIARLDALRLAAIEERVDADLALGRSTEVVPELEALVHEHPLRERLRGQLMLALYRAGRQAEALEAYANARRALLDELGLEPGPTLRALQAGILAQDKALEAPARPAAVLMRRRRKGGVLIALGGVTVLAAAAVAAVVAISGSGTPAVGAVRPLSDSFCSPMHHRSGASPRFLVVSDQELQGPEQQLGNQMAAAVEYVLSKNHFQAGRYAVAYQACDDATVTEGGGSTAKCSANAREYSRNASVIGIVGPTLSKCAVVQLPIANRAPGGPLPMISPSTTKVGLTRAGLGADADEPGRYYPTGTRNYVRIMPADDFQVAANAVLARRHGLKNVFVLSDATFADGAASFASAAAKVGLDVAGSAEWGADAGDDELAHRVTRSGADGVFLFGSLSGGGAALLDALRSEPGPHVPILASDGFSVADLLADVGQAAEGLRVSVGGIAPEALTGQRRRLLQQLEQALGEAPQQLSVYAAQATQILLDAIARSDGTRRSVIHELFASHVRNGILGDFDVTESGDTSTSQVTIYRVSHGLLRLDRIITPPLSLVVRR